MTIPTAIEVAQAPLPQTHESAKAALAECAKIDECKDQMKLRQTKLVAIVHEIREKIQGFHQGDLFE